MTWEIKKQFVYLIGPADGSVFKIGRTSNVENRLRSLQAGNPATLSVLWTAPGSVLIECELHRWFENGWVRGEWFDFGDLDPVATINAAIEIINEWWAPRTPRYYVPADPRYAHLRPPVPGKKENPS